MKTIGIIGAGSMGTGIAQVAAQSGCELRIYDLNKKSIEKSRDQTLSTFNKLVNKEKWSDAEAKEIFSRYYYSTELDILSDCDLIIEAIVENLNVKVEVLQKLEEFVSPKCILASNTSSLSISAIAARLKNPKRMIGLHFFNPAPIMSLVEIVPALQSHQDLGSEMYDLMVTWGKTPVYAKDTPGFIVNRVARPFYGEALRILDEGICNVETIDHAMTEILGFRMGPFTLMDYIGHDVNYAVTETTFKSFYYDPRYKPSFTQKQLVEAGFLGRKTGRGFYNYSQPETKQIEQDSKLQHQVAQRIRIMLINEAADAVYWNVASAHDIDLAMTKGVNYPKGLLKWADELGIAQCVEQMDQLYARYHEDRYRCSPILRQMVEDQKSFFHDA